MSTEPKLWNLATLKSARYDASGAVEVDSNNPVGPLLATTSPPTAEAQMDEIMSFSFIEEAKERAGVRPVSPLLPPTVKVESREPTLLKVIVDGPDPEVVTRLANTITNLHVARTELTQSRGLRDAIAFLDARHRAAEAELSKAEKALLAFREPRRLLGLRVDGRTRDGHAHRALQIRPPPLDRRQKRRYHLGASGRRRIPP